MSPPTAASAVPRSAVAAACLLLLAFLAGPAAAQPAPAAPTAAPAPRVVLETSLGTMAFRLLPEAAPRTVEHFRSLVEEGFYDGLPFYRVVSGHVIQAGDGGENDRPTVPLEASTEPGAPRHVKGCLGLARDEDPDSGSTEIYVCHADRPHLDGRYAVFGQLEEGFEVLDAIAAVEVEEQWVGDEGQVAFHEPKVPVVIERARIVTAAEAAQDEAAPR